MKALLAILAVVFACMSLQAQAPFRRNYYTTNAAPAGSINWIDVTTNSYTLGNIGIGTTPITAQKLTLQVDNLAASPINGLFLTNSTPATVGAQLQYSPSIYQSGGAWLTGSLSNGPVSFRSSVVPSQGGTSPAGTWKLESSLNGAAFGGGLTLTSSGAVGISTDLTVGSHIRAGASSGIGWITRSFLYSPADGQITADNFASNARSTIQHNIPQITKTSNYTIVALDSGLRFNNIGAVATNRLDLPTAVANMRFMGYVDSAFRMQFQAVGSDVIRDAAAVSGAAAGIWADAPGECIELFSPKAGVWVVHSKNGVWTIE